jgi:transposase
MDAQSVDDIIYALRGYMSIRKIAALMHVGRDRVSEIIRSHAENVRLDHTLGRPKKVSREVIDRIVTLSLMNGHLSDQMIADTLRIESGFQIHRTTVNSVRHAENINFAPPKKCPKLNENQIHCRQQFVRDWQGGMFDELKRLPFVFSDESRFCFGSDNRWTWQRRGYYNWSSLSVHDKFPQFSIMVWGAIGPDFKSELIICDGFINSEKYLTSLQQGFFNHANAHFQKWLWVFVQDGAPCHTSSYSLDEITNQCVLMPCWPPNSPDLNVIEVVWAIMKRRLKQDGIRSKAAAIQSIRNEWSNLSFYTINRLVQSFETRVRLVGDANGQTIQPLLSAHKESVPPGYLSGRPIIPCLYPWTSDEDSKILELIEKGEPTHWKKLTRRYFPTRTWVGLKNRWNTLKIKGRNALRFRS